MMLQLQKGLAKLFNLGDEPTKIVKGLVQEERTAVEVMYKPLEKDAHNQYMTVEEIAQAEASYQRNEVVSNLFHLVETDKFSITKSWLTEEDSEYELPIEDMIELYTNKPLTEDFNETEREKALAHWNSEKEKGSVRTIEKGTWLVKTHYGDEALWELKKSGKMGGLSLGGYGHVNKATGEITKVRFNKDEYLEAMKEDEE